MIPVDAVPGGAPDPDNVIWMGPHGAIVVYRMRRDELINVVCHYDDADYRHESWITRVRSRRGARALPRLARVAARTFSAGEVWYKWALYDRDPIPRWTRGRATVLGDAAHPMLPYLGQGACQSIEDGCVLAAALAADARGPAAARSRATSARAGRGRATVVLASRARGDEQPPHLAAGRAEARPADRASESASAARPEARGGGWIWEYDAGSPERAGDLTAPDGDGVAVANAYTSGTRG